MREYLKALGKRIRETRTSQGLSGRKLAEQAQVSYAYINEIERGNKQPSLDTLMAIASALKVTIGFLMGETELGMIPDLDETWKHFYERLVKHNPELEFWFRSEREDLNEKDYQALSNIVLSFMKSYQK